MTTSFSVQPHFHVWQRYNKPNPNPTPGKSKNRWWRVLAGVAKGVHTLACGGMCSWHVQAWWRQSPAPACQRVPACAGRHRHAACQCVPALGPMPPHTPQCTCMALGWPWVPLATRGGSRGQGAWPNVAPIGRHCKPPGQAAWPAVPGAARACGCLPCPGQP